jgi:hypothetical protein
VLREAGNDCQLISKSEFQEDKFADREPSGRMDLAVAQRRLQKIGRNSFLNQVALLEGVTGQLMSPRGRAVSSLKVHPGAQYDKISLQAFCRCLSPLASGS